MGKVEPIVSLNKFKEIINQDKYTVFDFWATWCGPCRVISPIFEKLAEANKSANVEFYKVDVDEAADISHELNIRAMPTFIAFKNGEKFKDLVGANPPALEALVASLK